MGKKVKQKCINICFIILIIKRLDEGMKEWITLTVGSRVCSRVCDLWSSSSWWEAADTPSTASTPRATSCRSRAGGSDQRSVCDHPHTHSDGRSLTLLSDNTQRHTSDTSTGQLNKYDRTLFLSRPTLKKYYFHMYHNIIWVKMRSFDSLKKYFIDVIRLIQAFKCNMRNCRPIKMFFCLFVYFRNCTLIYVLL